MDCYRFVKISVRSHLSKPRFSIIPMSTRNSIALRQHQPVAITTVKLGRSSKQFATTTSPKPSKALRIALRDCLQSVFSPQRLSDRISGFLGGPGPIYAGVPIASNSNLLTLDNAPGSGVIRSDAIESGLIRSDSPESGEIF